jgi:hypothetical protein
MGETFANMFAEIMKDSNTCVLNATLRANSVATVTFGSMSRAFMMELFTHVINVILTRFIVFLSFFVSMTNVFISVASLYAKSVERSVVARVTYVGILMATTF